MYNTYQVPLTDDREVRVGTGWLPPLPDLRDYTEEVKDIPKMAAQLGIALEEEPDLPDSTDWREFCTPVESQGRLGSCTAHAAVGAAEYYQRRAFGEHIEGSRLFVYKATRNLMGVTGDTGAWLRNTMGALVCCGVAPERYWPYQIELFDEDPPPFVYAVADQYQAAKYFCHDPLGQDRPRDQVLRRVNYVLRIADALRLESHGIRRGRFACRPIRCGSLETFRPVPETPGVSCPFEGKG